MIHILLNNPKFEHDVYALAKAFYPRQDVRVEMLEQEASQDCVSLRLEFLPDDEGNLAPSVSSQPSESESPELELSVSLVEHKSTKNELKRQLYAELSARTKKALPWGTLTGIRPTKIFYSDLEAGLSQEQVLAQNKQTYLLSDAKAQLALQIATTERQLLSAFDYQGGYSLYIGIPFCPSTCLYCSFTSFPVAVWEKRMGEYLAALYKEIEFVAANLGDRPLHTIYIGGGTPTSISAEQMDELLTKIESTLPLANLREFTVEAGRPDSITYEKLAAIRAHSVSRISINPQTMNQKTLDLIGRRHSVKQVDESFAMARQLGFDNINMDLILGLPGEDLADVKHTLAEVKKLNPDNLTVHSLALKRSARLNIEWDKYHSYLMENSTAHMDAAIEAAGAIGMAPYYLYRQKNMAGNLENIGFAKAGKEGLYNILIMEEKQTIIALGAGAACKFVFDGGERVERTENVKDVATYISRIDEMIDRKRGMIALL